MDIVELIVFAFNKIFLGFFSVSLSVCFHFVYLIKLHFTICIFHIIIFCLCCCWKEWKNVQTTTKWAVALTKKKIKFYMRAANKSRWNKKKYIFFVCTFTKWSFFKKKKLLFHPLFAICLFSSFILFAIFFCVFFFF